MTGVTHRSDRLLRHGWRSWLTLYGVWAIPALMTGLGGYSIQSAAGQAADLPRMLVQQLWYFGIFASICPAIYRLNVRFPFARDRAVAAVAAHLLAGGVVTAGAMILVAVFDVLTGTRPLAIPDAIVVEFTTPRGQFRGIINVFYYVVVAGSMMTIRIDRERSAHESRVRELAIETSRLGALVAEARLEALEMQLNPHFLFNALNGIASLVEQRRADDAYRAIGLLGELLRETLDAGRRHLVAIRDELESVEKYLALQRLRFSDRLVTEVHLPEELAGVGVPSMILQPLVENSIRHALSVKPGPCKVVIDVALDAGKLRVRVDDDGPGLPDEWSFEGRAGVGLRNVAERLRALYGDDARLDVESRDPSGVSSTILLPVRDPGSDPREAP